MKNLTERNIRKLAELPAGFTLEVRNLGPVNPQPEWTAATVVSYYVDEQGRHCLDLRAWDERSAAFYTWALYETTCHTDEPHLSVGSGADVACVRWSTFALEIFRTFSDDVTFAASVSTVVA